MGEENTTIRKIAGGLLAAGLASTQALRHWARRRLAGTKSHARLIGAACAHYESPQEIGIAPVLALGRCACHAAALRSTAARIRAARHATT